MSYHRIVVGVDFSTASLNAVRWVAGQFAPQARIRVVHVVSEPRVPAFLGVDRFDIPRVQRAERIGVADPARAEPTLYPGLRVFADLAGAGRSDVEIRTGSPATELARIAQEIDADLICVGRTRKRRGSGRFGATTPQRLLSRTNIPVLIVPDTARLTPGAVLAAVSDGRDGVEVLRAAGRLAAAWDVRLDALHAIEADALDYAQRLFATGGSGPCTSAPHAAIGEPTTEPSTAFGGESQCCQLAEEWIVRQAAALPLQGARVHALARVGDAGEEAIAHAARNGIGLIVAGRSSDDGRTEGVAFDLGSTTRLITWASACPVLVLGAPAVGATSAAPADARLEPWRTTGTPRFEVTGGRVVVRALRARRRPGPGDGNDAA